MTEHKFPHELFPELRSQAALENERDRLERELQHLRSRLLKRVLFLAPAVGLCVYYCYSYGPREWSLKAIALSTLGSTFVFLPVILTLVQSFSILGQWKRTRQWLHNWQGAMNDYSRVSGQPDSDRQLQ